MRDFTSNDFFYEMEIGKSATCGLDQDNFGKWKSLFGYVELAFILAVFLQVFGRFFATVNSSCIFSLKKLRKNFRKLE